MIQRLVTPYPSRLLQGFPVVTLTGPRQSGKTTLVYGGTENATFKGIRVLGWSSVPALYPVAE